MELLERVKSLNDRATALNKQREKALWERNRAEEELKKLLADYNAKYGVTLTIDMIEQEYDAVIKSVTEQANILEQQIKKIESGEEVDKTLSGINSTTTNGNSTSVNSAVGGNAVSTNEVDNATTATNVATNAVGDTNSASVTSSANGVDIVAPIPSPVNSSTQGVRGVAGGTVGQGQQPISQPTNQSASQQPVQSVNQQADQAVQSASQQSGQQVGQQASQAVNAVNFGWGNRYAFGNIQNAPNPSTSPVTNQQTGSTSSSEGVPNAVSEPRIGRFDPDMDFKKYIK